MVVGMATATAAAAGALLSVRSSDIPRTKEKELRVRVEAAFGTVRIGKGDPDKILRANFTQEESERRGPDISYTVANNRGDLRIEGQDARFWRSSKSRDRAERRWNLEFTDAIPIDMGIEFGAGEGEIDLTGLKISKLNVSTGASSVNLVCNTPNEVVAERVDIESGVSKFDARGLGNLNFRRMKFSGGVGAYRLDFGERLLRDGTVNVEVGLGAVTILLPKTAGARVQFDHHILSSFEADDCLHRVSKGVYETENYRTAVTTLEIEVSSGLGSVRIRHR
jgi:hypothetical protein